MTNDINIETFGSGPRQVVALHCSLGRAAGWSSLAKLLGDDVTVTAPDWPGHGKSAPWQQTGLMRETAVKITEQLIGDQPIDLIGHSYGGVIALDYATRFPEKVRSLTLIEPIFLAVVGLDNRPVLDSYLNQMQPHFDALADERHEEAANIFMDIWGGGVNWSTLPEAARIGLTKQIPVVDACKPGDENSPEEIRVLDSLDQLNMPIKLIYGANTLPVVQHVMQGLQHRLPKAGMTVIDGAGHMVPLSHAEQVAASIKANW